MYKILNVSILMFILLTCNTKNDKQINENKSKGDTLTQFQVTVIAHLPDSLQPPVIYLKKMPKPLIVKVPAKKGDFYTRTNSKGNEIKVNLEPPIYKPFDVLQNNKGETVFDQHGNPFIIGNYGKSNFKNFTTDEGLVSDGITCSLLDRYGNLWFGTYGNGVIKYDGKTFSNYTSSHGLANDLIHQIFEDKAGNLWLGTNGSGLSKYDGEIFTNYNTTHGLASNVILSIAQDKDENLWFGTEGGGVSRFDGKTFKNYTIKNGLANNVILSIAQDRIGNLWFGTEGGGISRFDGKIFTNLSIEQGLASSVVSSILNDKFGNIWIGTNGGGVSKYDFNRENYPCNNITCKHNLLIEQDLHEHNNELSKAFANFSTAQGLVSNKVTCIKEDKIGNIWFSTIDRGISCFDGKTFRNFTKKQGLADNKVLCITEDKYGHLWFGTYGSGISRFDGHAISNFTTELGLTDNMVYSIAEDKTGKLWFGTTKGLSIFDGKSFTCFTNTQGIPVDDIFSIMEDKKGNVWLGTYNGGVIIFDGQSFCNLTTRQGLANKIVSAIKEDKYGNIWLGTFGGGISRFDGESFCNYTTDQGLANNIILCIYEEKKADKSVIWFGTEEGVSIFDGKTFSNLNTSNGLIGNSVSAITKDRKGNLWLGTTKGLCVIKKDDLKYFDLKSNFIGKYYIKKNIITSFTTEDGLPSNSISQIIQMPNGKIAVGSDLGITLFNISEDLKKLTDIENFNSNTGYPVKAINSGQNCMYLDSKGTIWAGTGSEKTALVRFDYNSLYNNNKPPVLAIQSIKIRDENICWYNLLTKGVRKNKQDSNTALFHEFNTYGKQLSETKRDSVLKHLGNIKFTGISKFYSLPQNLVLPHEHNQIDFEYVAIETGKPFLVKYKYKLEGYDKNWSQITNRSNVTFNNLYEGTYTFKLKAQGANGVWTKPLTYTFKVLPPWYRTWWAYLLYFISLISLIYLIIMWRNASIQKDKRKLEITVNERTEELKQKNELVLTQKEEAEKQKKQIEEALDVLRNTQTQLIQSENQKNIAIEKTRIARDMHDDIGSGLTQISILINLLKNHENTQGSFAEINKISIIVNELVENMSQIIWAMNAENDKFQNLLGYLRKFSMDYFENSSIECKLKFPESYDSIELSSTIRRNLFLVIKETYHNILKHSRAGIVNVEVKLDANKIKILIEENGIGYNIQQSQTKGNGLNNMNKRMIDINGTYIVKSEIGNGSLTSLEIPLG